MSSDGPLPPLVAGSISNGPGPRPGSCFRSRPWTGGGLVGAPSVERGRGKRRGDGGGSCWREGGERQGVSSVPCTCERSRRRHRALDPLSNLPPGLSVPSAVKVPALSTGWVSMCGLLLGETWCFRLVEPLSRQKSSLPRRRARSRRLPRQHNRGGTAAGGWLSLYQTDRPGASTTARQKRFHYGVTASTLDGSAR